MTIRGALVQMGERRIDRNRWDWAEVERNPFFCPDAEAARLPLCCALAALSPCARDRRFQIVRVDDQFTGRVMYSQKSN